MKVIHESHFFLGSWIIHSTLSSMVLHRIREEDQLRVTFVMELCKENLMGRIFQNQDYIPVLNTWREV